MSEAVQGLWVGDRLSTLERLCASSFLKNGHEFHLYSYSDLDNVPPGVLLKDANEIIPERDVFSYFGGSLAGFADWFRWELLYKQGGYWVDMDVLCLRRFDFKDEIVFGFQEGSSPAVGVLRFPRGHPFAQHMLKRCVDPNRIQPYDGSRTRWHKRVRRYLLGNKRDRIYWGEAGGPIGFEFAVRHFGLQPLGKPYTCFYPVHSSHWRALFDETLGKDLSLFADTYAVHLWNELIRRAGVDKDGLFPEQSFIEKQKKRYL